MILLASFYMSRMMCSIDGISTVFFILLPLLSMVFDGYGPLLVKRCNGFDGSIKPNKHFIQTCSICKGCIICLPILSKLSVLLHLIQVVWYWTVQTPLQVKCHTIV